MLLILSVLFLILNINALRNGTFLGKIFKGFYVKDLEFRINSLDGKYVSDKERTENNICLILVSLISIVGLIIELILFANLWEYDYLKYPTMICILLTFAPLAKKSSSSVDNKEELIVLKAKQQDKIKNPHTLYGVTSAVVHICYYIYAIYILCGA
ncbi:hypothetical protein [Anaerosinus massiliensis]|uniref:hypothetical protein n=1 Tax=Massilibacillus massiliensis TaxID=1806837 RepID=UPI000DA62E59|nr:hypothetical protein [Massilibacillus massiliensis]